MLEVELLLLTKNLTAMQDLVDRKVPIINLSHKVLNPINFQELSLSLVVLSSASLEAAESENSIRHSYESHHPNFLR